MRKKRYMAIIALVIAGMIWGAAGCAPKQSDAAEMKGQINRENSQDLEINQHEKELPNIVIIATGGTIAGSAKTADKTAGYEAAAVLIDTLLEAVPGLDKIANITAEQYCQIASENFTPDDWLALSKHVSKVLEREEVCGAVITHGTDTMEETAYFLNLTGRVRLLR